MQEKYEKKSKKQNRNKKYKLKTLPLVCKDSSRNEAASNERRKSEKAFSTYVQYAICIE